MFNIGGGEFLIIFLVALVVLGPTKLPEAARQLGKVVGEFRRISSGFQREIQSAMNDPVSKVTGESTPTTFKDITTVAEPPPMETPDASSTPSTTPSPSSLRFSSAEPAKPTAAPIESAVESLDDTDEANAPEAGDPPMFGDR